MTHQFINREISWLEFNQRVLDEARCDSNPLLERLKFVAISGSNLDEFFMVRIGGLKFLHSIDKPGLSIDQLTARQQLDLLYPRVREMKSLQYETLKEIENELVEKGVQRLPTDQLTPQQKESIAIRFEQELHSVFTPIAIHDDSEFPLLLNSKQAILIQLQNDPGKTLVGENQGDDASGMRYVVIPLGSVIDRFITVPSKDHYQYVLLEDLLASRIGNFFPGQQIVDTGTFRVLRNADIPIDDDETSDLLVGMQEMLNARKTSDCVLLEHSATMSDSMVSFLKKKLEVADEETYSVDGPLNLSAYWGLVGIQGFDELRNPKRSPLPVAEFQSDADIFDTIAEKDRILIHPYQTFEPVVRFIEAAAEDPDVISIKQTLYRSSRDSRIVNALKTAAENGKSVTAIVELKARFDEERNIQWAQTLEQAGADVIYGIKGLKTHAKCCVVVRKEPAGIRRYVHVGTGNYNEVTANIYSDVSLLTCDEQIGSDAVSFFNGVSGFSVPQTLQHLVAAPTDLRKTILALIDFERRRAKAKKTAMISAKLNSLVDREMIEGLYRASQAGVKIRLNIRGICCLRAGVPGLSENIQVCSIVDRYLEHARIIHFHSGGEHKVFISSADWMSRNLNKRIELMTPINDSDCKSVLLEVLECYFRDNVKSSVLGPDDQYAKVNAETNSEFRSQEILFQMASQWFEENDRNQATVFLPHRGDSETA